MDCDKLLKLERRILALEILDKYNFHKKEPSPPFSPGDLVMRKDGKAISEYFHYYVAKIRSIEYRPHAMCILWGENVESITINELRADDLTLAPPKPKPEDIKGYELTGEFRPPTIDDMSWHEELKAVVRRRFPLPGMPRWILRKKAEKRKVEFEGAIVMNSGFSFKVYHEGKNAIPNNLPCRITVEWTE